MIQCSSFVASTFGIVPKTVTRETGYLCVCSVGAVGGLHRQVVERTLLSIQRLCDDDGAHSLLYVKHAVAVSTCSREEGGKHSVSYTEILSIHNNYHKYLKTHKPESCIYKPMVFIYEQQCAEMPENLF